MKTYIITCKAGGYTTSGEHTTGDEESLKLITQALEKRALEVAMSMNGVHNDYKVTTKIKEKEGN